MKGVQYSGAMDSFNSLHEWLIEKGEPMSLEQKKKKQLIFGIVCLSLLTLLCAATVVGTPHTFVRIINTALVIICAGCVGAFIREAFIIFGKQSPHP